MEKQTKGFLQSAPGAFSSGRLMFALWGCFAMLMCGWVYADSHSAASALSIFMAIAGTATAHKGVQGHNENKAPGTAPATTTENGN